MWQGEGSEGEPGQVPKGLNCCSFLLLPKFSTTNSFLCSLSKTSRMSPRASALVEMVQEGKNLVPFGQKPGSDSAALALRPQQDGSLSQIPRDVSSRPELPRGCGILAWGRPGRCPLDAAALN